MATVLNLSAPERTALRDLPSHSDTSNFAALPCANIIQARCYMRILPGVWTVGTPYSLDSVSKTRPEMTAEYKLLSLALGNMAVCPGFPTKYLGNLNNLNLHSKYRRFVRGKSIQQGEKNHLASYITDARRMCAQIAPRFLYLVVQMTQKHTLQNRTIFPSFNRPL